MKETNLMSVHAPAPEISIADQIPILASYINAGISAWTKAGELLVKIVDAHPDAYAQIQKAMPGLSFDMITAFEKIGRRQIYPYLMIDNCPGTRRLLTFPYELQVKFYKQRVQVVTGRIGNQPQIAEKRIQQLSQRETHIVFSEEGPRTPDQQVEFIDQEQKSGRMPGRRTFRTRQERNEQKERLRSLGTFHLTITDGQPALTYDRAATPTQSIIIPPEGLMIELKIQNAP